MGISKAFILSRLFPLGNSRRVTGPGEWPLLAPRKWLGVYSKNARDPPSLLMSRVYLLQGEREG